MEGDLGFYQTDCEFILSHLKHQENQVQLKRRWLLGFPISKSEWKKFTEHRKSLPESLLRDDDLFCQTVKTCVQEAFGTSNAERVDLVIPRTGQSFDSTNMKGILLSCLDVLTNEGLFLVAMLFTKGSVRFQKTRKRMKQVIKESIPKVLGAENQDHARTDIVNQLFQLLSDPQNSREGCSVFPQSQFHYAAAIKVLEGLEDLPYETLVAMRRTLRGVPASTPRLKRRKQVHRRDKLINEVRKMSETMLSELGGSDELQPPLAKALAIAGLSLKLRQDWPNSCITDFNQFSPAVKTLQNEIGKAICLLKTKVRFPELQALQLLLDPDSQVSNGCLRTTIKNMLTDYLFECSELETIPKSLRKALAIINRSSRSTPGLLKEKIEDEVEHILSVSAHTKQIVWDLLPSHELDEEYADAYMEDLEDSEDSDDDDDGTVVTYGDGCQVKLGNSYGSRFCSIDADLQDESTGDYIPVDSKPDICSPERSFDSSTIQETRCIDGLHNGNAHHFEIESMHTFGTLRSNKRSFSPHLDSDRRVDRNFTAGIGPTGDLPGETSKSSPTVISEKQSTFNNRYLGIQEACDQMSLTAYNLIGNIMEGLAQGEGLDLDCSDSSYLRGDYCRQESQEAKSRSKRNVTGTVIVQVVEKLVPSLSDSAFKKLEELIGL